MSNRIDYFLQGNTYKRKVRDATNYENWCIRHFDMRTVIEISDMAATAGFGNGVDPALRNYVRTNASYEGITEDRKIQDEKAGNNQEIIENNPLVKTYREESDQDEYDYRSEGKETDSTVTTYTYLEDVVEGNVVQDWKIHKSTNHGRPVSKKYIQKNR